MEYLRIYFLKEKLCFAFFHTRLNNFEQYLELISTNKYYIAPIVIRVNNDSSFFSHRENVITKDAQSSSVMTFRLTSPTVIYHDNYRCVSTKMPRNYTF